jgi:hypothetical protein
MKRNTPTTRQWPCIFRDPTVSATVDPLLANEWQQTYGRRSVPFGDLRNQWRKQHCQTLNPYGSVTCPYALQDCVRAFAEVAMIVASDRKSSPVGYFRKVAKDRAARRADAKPLARESAHAASVSRDPATPSTDLGPGSWVRSPDGGFSSIGDLLRALDPRSREGGTTAGYPSTVGPEASGDAVPVAPPRSTGGDDLGHDEGTS